MIKNRRKFIQRAGALSAAAVLLPTWACNSAASNSPLVGNMIKGDLESYGIQLYTLREDLPKDPKGILKQLADFGYKNIESYEGKQGMFHGMTNLDFKSYMDDLGMKINSAHSNINQDFERKAAEAAEIGMEYLICPYIGPQTSVAAWKEVTEKFNKCGAICKKNGIKFAYHNHAYTFKAFSGMIPHDFLMENTDPELVDHQMDIYWVVTGGADPIDYLKKYSGRFTLCHVKDRMKDAGDEREASCDLGTGIIDFPSILKVAKENGMKHYILEQERYDNSTPLQSAKAGATYLKNFKFA